MAVAVCTAMEVVLAVPGVPVVNSNTYVVSGKLLLLEYQNSKSVGEGY